MTIHTLKGTRRLGATGVLLSVAAAVAITPGLATPAYADTNCTPYKIVAVPGTSETNSNANTSQPVGLLKSIPDLVTNAGSPVSSEFVAYPASAFAGGADYSTSEAEGVAKTKSILSGTATRCPATKILLVGYSQGADVAGDVAAEIGSGRGPIPKDRLAGTVLIADPQRGTPMESVVGPNPPGTGILGPRTGFATDVATICDPAPDLYCATDDPMVQGIGEIIGNTRLGDPSQTSPPGTTTLASDPVDNALSQGLSAFNVDGLKSGVKKLTDAATSGDRSAIATAATGLQSTTSNLATISNNLDKSSAAATLNEFPQGTQQKQASSVLGSVKSVDVATLSTLLQTLASAGESLGLDQLTGAASSVVQTVAPLAGVGTSDITTASSIVQGIQPVAILRNAAVVTDKISRIDFVGIFDDLKSLFDLAVAGRFGDLPAAVNALNQKLVSVVAAVDAVDLAPLITILSMIPEPNCQIAAQVIKVINNLDLTKLAQDMADIVKYVLAGQLLAVPTLVLDMFTTGIDATGLLSGVDLSSLSKITESLNPATVVDSASHVVSFYAGGAHTNYQNLVVDDQGRNALQWTADWFASLAKG